jgi:hypothetical protein
MSAARAAADRDRRVPAKGSKAVGVLLDLFLLGVFAVLCVLIARDGLESVRERDRIRAVYAEAKKLYEGFRRYHERNRAYPHPDVEPRFETDTLEPLRRRGYYRGELATYLVEGRIDAYDSPDDRGAGREFWAEMTLASDPNVRILVARSDDAPLSRGKWMDGVFVLRGGKVEPL